MGFSAKSTVFCCCFSFFPFRRLFFFFILLWKNSKAINHFWTFGQLLCHAVVGCCHFEKSVRRIAWKMNVRFGSTWRCHLARIISARCSVNVFICCRCQKSCRSTGLGLERATNPIESECFAFTFCRGRGRFLVDLSCTKRIEYRIFRLLCICHTHTHSHELPLLGCN